MNGHHQCPHPSPICQLTFASWLLGMLAVGIELPSSLENCPQLIEASSWGDYGQWSTLWGSKDSPPCLQGGVNWVVLHAQNRLWGQADSLQLRSPGMASSHTQPGPSLFVFTLILSWALANKSLVQKPSSQALLLGTSDAKERMRSNPYMRHPIRSDIIITGIINCSWV